MSHKPFEDQLLTSIESWGNRTPEDEDDVEEEENEDDDEFIFDD